MTEERHHSASRSDRGEPLSSRADSTVESLREILFGRYRQRLAELQAEVDDLERQVTDRDALIGTIAPVLGDVIRRKIRDAREEMIDALYPIIGQVVVRAVSEAIRDLARTIDARMRRSLDLRAIGRRLRARLSGVSDAELVLRESLPFAVTEILLIHRETGLLLWHVSGDPEGMPDSDLISGMLTAIRDFAQDALGQGREGQLDEIQYGEQRILIEAAQYAYLAVVVEGIEPPGFQAEMRERVIEVSHAYERVLRHYDGDPTPLAPVEGSLRSLLTAAQPRALSIAQKRVLTGAIGLAFACVVVACLAGGWAWRAISATPTAVPVAVEPSPTSTLAPSPTFTAPATPSPTPTPMPSSTPTDTPSPPPTSTPPPTPTWTATSTPTATPSPTLTPTPAPVVGLMTGNVWVRQGPGADSERLGLILERGQAVEIVAVCGNWCQVRWSPHEGAQVVGWVPLQWVGTTTPIPAGVITPTVESS